MKLECVSEADGGKAAKTAGRARSTIVKEITTRYNNEAQDNERNTEREPIGQKLA